jgi:hypothetical protein
MERGIKSGMLALVLLVMTAVAVYAAVSLRLDAGDSVSIFCTGDDLTLTQADAVSALAVCSAEAEPTATPVPVATDTPAPEPTPTHDHHMDEADLRWHAPGVAHGDRPPHEHGDAPPQWLIDAGINPTYSHVGGTPGENHSYWKHSAFKGWAGRFTDNQDWYGVFHLDFNPGGHASRFHSYQLWVKDATGAISSFSGWLDFGQGNQTGPNLVVVCGQASNERPIIMVNQTGCNPLFETWYARAAGSGDWAPDFGFSIAPNYFAGGDPNDPTTWTAINPWPNNANRRLEFAWYANRSTLRGEFWTTQWGAVVNGPSDPICGSERTIGERTYAVACLRQFIAPTLQSIQFPGNAIQRTFPDDGVELPN